MSPDFPPLRLGCKPGEGRDHYLEVYSGAEIASGVLALLTQKVEAHRTSGVKTPDLIRPNPVKSRKIAIRQK